MTNARTGPVRRSSRLRQKTSPYFGNKAKGLDSNASTPKGSVTASDRKSASGIGSKTSSSSTATKAPATKARSRKSKGKAASTISKRKDESEAPTEIVSEERRVHGIARRANFYGLIQEVVAPNVFRLLVATCLLNQTKGRAAMPVFWELLRRWPDEHSLAKADVVELTDLLQPIGLHNIRAHRLINMSKTMVEIPYDENNSFKSRDRTAPDTPIGIYPGVGRYAIDSWRIFIAGGGASVGLQGDKPVSPFDTLVALTPPEGDEKPQVAISVSQEAEWKSVMPLDKELRAYLVWRWEKEGHIWDPVRGVVPPKLKSE